MALPLDMKLARFGELTSLITLISPLPAFISCHKSSYEKNQMLGKISFNFLVAMFVTNLVWLFYSIKIDNMDLIVINALGTIIAGSFTTLYLYVKSKVTQPHSHLAKFMIGLIFAFAMGSDLTTPWANGLISTTLSMSQYVFTLDSVKIILQTKDPSKVNLLVAICCILNSFAWGAYAICVADIFVFIPNLAAVFAGIIQFSLYLWTSGSIDDSSPIIKLLHKQCLKKSKGNKLLPRKIKREEDLDEENRLVNKATMDVEDSTHQFEREEDTMDNSLNANNFSTQKRVKSSNSGPQQV